MGLVAQARFDSSPPYWGWLKPLLLDELEAAHKSLLDSSDPMAAGAAQATRVQVEKTLAFIGLHPALEITGATGDQELEGLLRLHYFVATIDHPVSSDTANAFQEAFLEDIRSFSSTLEAHQDGSSSLLEAPSFLLEHQKIAHYLGLERIEGLIEGIASALEGHQTGWEQRVANNIIGIEDALADWTFLGTDAQVLGSHVALARNSLTALHEVLENDLFVLRQQLTEKQTDQSTSSLILGMACVFHLLEIDRLADRLEAIAKETDPSKAMALAPEAIAWAEAMTESLRVFTPHVDNFIPTPLLAPTAPTLPNLESVENTQACVENWVRQGAEEDRTKLLEVIENFQTTQENLKPLMETMARVLRAAEGKPLSDLSLTVRAAVLHGYRTLQSSRDTDSPPDVSASLSKLALALRELGGRDVLPPAPVKQEPAKNPWQWEAYTRESTREAFWLFAADHSGVLADPTHPDFWLALGWLKASLNLVSSDQHPFASFFEEASATRELNSQAKEALSAIQARVADRQSTEMPSLIPLLELQLAVAKEAWKKGDKAKAKQALEEQAQLLSDQGFHPQESF